MTKFPEDKPLTKRNCMDHGCPNTDSIDKQLLLIVKNCKEHINGSESSINKRIDDMKTEVGNKIVTVDKFHTMRWKILGTVVLTVIAMSGGLYAWASDKGDEQRDKITRIESETQQHSEAWERREVLDQQLLDALTGINSWMIESKTKMEIYHPGSIGE